MIMAKLLNSNNNNNNNNNNKKENKGADKSCFNLGFSAVAWTFCVLESVCVSATAEGQANFN